MFASDVRESIMNTVKGEGLGMGECMKRISLAWHDLPETAKAKYSEESASQ